MNDLTPETLLATVNQIHERFMRMMGRVPEGIANDLADVQLAAAAWKADRKRLQAMDTTPMMLALAHSLLDWQDSGSMTGEVEIFVPVDIARAIRIWIAGQEQSNA